MIELIKRRPIYKSGRGGRHIDTRFPLGLFAPSVDELFQNLDGYLEKILPEERWNIFYTQDPDVTTFDVDFITPGKQKLVAQAVIDALGIWPLAIVSTGNGINVLYKAKFNYKEASKLIDVAIKKKGLFGLTDDLLSARYPVLRLPGTENRKQRLPESLPNQSHRTQCVLMNLDQLEVPNQAKNLS